MKKLKLEISINEINVEDGFYEVHYSYSINGKAKESDMYDSDFENGMSDKEWKKELESGYAIKVALGKIAEEF